MKLQVGKWESEQVSRSRFPVFPFSHFLAKAPRQRPSRATRRLPRSTLNESRAACLHLLIHARSFSFANSHRCGISMWINRSSCKVELALSAAYEKTGKRAHLRDLFILSHLPTASATNATALKRTLLTGVIAWRRSHRQRPQP